MSKHNILFYSSHPNDILSQNIIQELNKDELLKQQFVTICVNSPGIKLPKMIIEKNEIPVIITRGFNLPIAGEAALKWIQQHNSGKAVGLDYGDPSKAAQVSEDHGILAAESGRTSYHQSFNDDWNLGTENDVRTVSSIEDTNTMDTIEEKSKHNTAGLKTDLDQRLKIRDNQRQREGPQSVSRIGGGIPNEKSNGLSLNQVLPNNQRAAPQYNPQQFRQPPPSTPNFNIKQQTGQQSTINNPYNPTGLMGRPMSDSKIFPQQTTQARPAVSPPGNPLYPPARQVNRDYPGNLGPAKAGLGGFPELPTGFGQGGSGGVGTSGGSNFSSFDNAFSGQTLMGTNMETKFNNTRREKTLSPGLPGGRGHAGPVNEIINTSTF